MFLLKLIHTPEWFFRASRKFDHYPRGSAKVYFGEYAANGLMAGKMTDDAHANSFLTALSEAAFLTGVERNCDEVEMTSYAPLFNLAEAAQWPHNLIVFNPKAVMKTTNYFVQQMFASHVGKTSVDVAGEFPENLYASATEDEHALYIKLVNSGAAGIPVSIHLNTGANQVSAVVFQSNDLTGRNQLSYSGSPEYNILPVEKAIKIRDGILSVDLERYSVCVITAAKQASGQTLDVS